MTPLRALWKAPPTRARRGFHTAWSGHRWAPDPRNQVLFTERPHPDTLGRLLVDFYLQHQPPPRVLPLVVHRRVPLQGQELEAFQEQQREVRDAKLGEVRAAREEREREEAARTKVSIRTFSLGSDLSRWTVFLTPMVPLWGTGDGDGER